MGRLIAAADVGSNTAHLLIAHITNSGLKRLVNESEWLSLGEVVSREGRISESKLKELMATIGRFRSLIDQYKVEDAAFFATEAMRRADNHDEIIALIKEKYDIKVEIISPRREAELSYLSTQMDCGGTESTVLIEAGGGSVQVAYCENGEIQELTSLPIGSGTLRARSGLDQPATEYSLARVNEIIQNECQEVAGYPTPKRIIACGGVSRGLWRALHPDGEQTLSVEELEFLSWDCARLTTEVIVDRYDVKLNRAKTLLAGSLTLRHLMGMFGHSEVRVSRYGVREGAILEIARLQEDEWLTE